MRIHREICPIVQLLLDDFSRGLRHQAERIAGQVDEWLAVFAERHVKFFAEPSQRILGVELKREAFVR